MPKLFFYIFYFFGIAIIPKIPSKILCFVYIYIFIYFIYIYDVIYVRFFKKDFWNIYIAAIKKIPKSHFFPVNLKF